MLTDGGIRLGVVVSDLHGQSARAMVKAIIDGQPPHEVLKLASRRLKASREEIFDARLLGALAHKLLRTIFFMLNRGEHYRDSATDYEALSVQRNAPRWIKALTRFGFIPKPA